MAEILPKSSDYYETGSSGERRIYESLKENLNDDWLVIHSFRWIKLQSTTGRKSQGEGDFILFNRFKGILVIEVKGGAVEYIDREWYSTDYKRERHKIQDPEKQANDTKQQLIARFKSKKIFGLPIFHAVWFPDVVITNFANMPVNYNTDIVFDASSLENPLLKIEKAFEYWFEVTNFHSPNLNKEMIEEVKRILKPQLRLVKTFKRLKEDINDTYVRLNNEQIMLLENLNMCKELSVIGRAGTGKTLIAIEKSLRDTRDNKKVLFLCYNTELAKRIKESNGELEKVHTIHAFALDYMKKYHPARVQGEFNTNEDFEYLMSEFLEVGHQPFEQYDSIIIDEGQDFEKSWINTIQRFKSDEGSFYIFYDPYQNFFSSDSKFDDQYLKIGMPFILVKNMRNTDQISKTCLNIINQEIKEDYLNGVKGKDPEITFIENKSDLEDRLFSKLHELQFVEKIHSNEIAILSLNSLKESWLKDEIINNTNVEIFTAKRFKGLENEFIIITDVDLSHIIDPVKQRLLYIALSRAKVHAIIYFHIDDRYKRLATNKLNCSIDELPNQIKAYLLEGEIQ
nr:NERD domain-containing protein [Paenibacillus bovis]